MFAVIKTGGKQYKVFPGNLVKLEKIEGEEGNSFQFEDVLMVGDEKTSKIGAPFLEKTLVKATVVEQARDKKIIVFKKKRRKGYQRKNGHRQSVTSVYIDEIVLDGKSVAKADRPAPKKVEKKPYIVFTPKQRGEKEEVAPQKKAEVSKKEAAPKKEAAKKDVKSEAKKPETKSKAAAPKKDAGKAASEKPAAKATTKAAAPKKDAAKKPETKK